MTRGRGAMLALALVAVSVSALPPSPAAAIARLVWQTPSSGVPQGAPVVALTFDDGPAPGYTEQILAVLNRYHVPATFFVVGRNLAAHPELVSAELGAGHRVSNHTWDHAYLTRTSDAAFPHQVDDTTAAISRLAGYRTSCVRPPYGASDGRVESLASSRGLTTVGWSVDSRDWARPGVVSIVNTVLANVRPGSVVLMHDGGGDRSQTVAALPSIIEGIQQRGLGFTTVCGPPPTPTRDVALLARRTAGYTLSGSGHLRSFGGAPELAGEPSWPGWDIARALALNPSGPGGWVLDGFGAVHAFGGAPVLTTSAAWPGWDVARDLVVLPGGRGGYVLDALGGIHPVGSAPSVTGGPYWPDQMVARRLALAESGGGYVLDANGGVHPFGGAANVTVSAYWPGQDAARDFVLAFDGRSGYVLDRVGLLHSFGSAPTTVHLGAVASPAAAVALFADGMSGVIVGSGPEDSPSTFRVAPPARAIAVDSTGRAGLQVDGFGAVTTFGPAGSSSVAAMWDWDIARSVAISSTGAGGYVLDGFGGVHSVGGAPPLSGGPYFGWDIARSLVLRADGVSGYVLDGFGGVHSVGGAPPLSGGPYFGWDIARSLVLRADGVGGYILDGFGGVHALGGAPKLSGGPYFGWDIARSLVLRRDGAGGYVLDGFGALHQVGAAARVSSGDYHPGAAVEVAASMGENGGQVIDIYGHRHAFPITTATIARLSWPGRSGFRWS